MYDLFFKKFNEKVLLSPGEEEQIKSLTKVNGFSCHRTMQKGLQAQYLCLKMSQASLLS